METTNAIIFQEQEDGSYKGIEVNSNGQPSEVGRIIYYNYQKPTDVKSIIDNHYYVAKLGASGQVLENIDYRDQRRNALYTKDGMKFPKYTIVSMVRGYYTANKLQAIIDGNITEHNEESKNEKEAERPYYSYCQTRSGKWFVIDYTKKGNHVAKRLHDTIKEQDKRQWQSLLEDIRTHAEKSNQKEAESTGLKVLDISDDSIFDRIPSDERVTDLFCYIQDHGHEHGIESNLTEDMKIVMHLTGLIALGSENATKEYIEDSVEVNKDFDKRLAKHLESAQIFSKDKMNENANFVHDMKHRVIIDIANQMTSNEGEHFKFYPLTDAQVIEFPSMTKYLDWKLEHFTSEELIVKIIFEGITEHDLEGAFLKSDGRVVVAIE